MTWVETGSAASPSFSATCSSTCGSMLAKVPTAPEMAQVAISARAATRRSRLRGEVGVDAGQLEAEGRRLGVDAVAAADGRRVLVLVRAALERGQQSVEIGQQQVGGRSAARKRGVEHVGRGHALMDEAGVRADISRQDWSGRR